MPSCWVFSSLYANRILYRYRSLKENLELVLGKHAPSVKWGFDTFLISLPKSFSFFVTSSPHWPTCQNVPVAEILVQSRKVPLWDSTAYVRRPFCLHMIKFIPGISQCLTIVGHHLTYIMSLLKEFFRAVIFQSVIPGPATSASPVKMQILGTPKTHRIRNFDGGCSNRPFIEPSKWYRGVLKSESPGHRVLCTFQIKQNHGFCGCYGRIKGITIT